MREADITCNWNALCTQLLTQWSALSRNELEQTGHSRHRIAELIENKYGISSQMAENYLHNFERTLPLFDA